MAILDLFRNVADRVQGGAANLGNSNIAQRVGSLFEQPDVDPNAVDPQTGMPQGMVNMANQQGLRNLAGLFLAAGQSQSGSDRAKLLAEAGNAMNPTKNLYNMAQARLMSQQAEDALTKRKRQQDARTALESADISGFSDQEKRVLQMYQQMGDTEGAASFLERLATRNAEGVQLADGSIATKGQVNADAMNWSKNYQPVIQSSEMKVGIINDALDLLDAGMTTGYRSYDRMTLDKLARLSGKQIDPATLNREGFNSLVTDITLARLKDLGGNDTEKEYERLAQALAGRDTEEETIRYNLVGTMKRSIEAATKANMQRSRIGGREYGAPIKWDESLVPDAYQTYWDRVNVSKTPAQNSGTGSSGGAPAPAATDYGKKFGY